MGDLSTGRIEQCGESGSYYQKRPEKRMSMVMNESEKDVSGLRGLEMQGHRKVRMTLDKRFKSLYLKQAMRRHGTYKKRLFCVSYYSFLFSFVFPQLPSSTLQRMRRE